MDNNIEVDILQLKEHNSNRSINIVQNLESYEFFRTLKYKQDILLCTTELNLYNEKTVIDPFKCNDIKEMTI